jgi:hypothetical protein
VPDGLLALVHLLERSRGSLLRVELDHIQEVAPAESR